ncbi:MAG: peptide chain release factor N(5)-glutamine methyltransferase [Smithellaceae bacterium]|nr:peptide chain release factor N(5)-glutamine methyltransferase [Smithellaceae bacterium]
MIIREMVKNTSLLLEEARSATPRLDAEVLLSHFLNIDRLVLITEPQRPLTDDEVRDFSFWVERRALGEPVAYITGRKEFWSLPFEVNRDVLIPRPETEILVEETLKEAAGREDIRILDLGTGSGAIAVALAHELKNARLVATDISHAALMTAERNARTNGVADRITFLPGDLFSPVDGSFDIIVSNPPYIAEEDFPLLPVGVKGYEPSSALLAGPDGTGVLRRIIEAAPTFLNPGGSLLLEIGARQREEVARLLGRAGFMEPVFRRDYAGHWRVARARINDQRSMINDH